VNENTETSRWVQWYCECVDTTTEMRSHVLRWLFCTGFRNLLSMQRMPDTGPGRPLKFPYSLGAKFLQFPFKVYWKKGRGFRYFAYAVLVSLIIVRPIDKFGMLNFLIKNVHIKFWHLDLINMLTVVIYSQISNLLCSTAVRNHMHIMYEQFSHVVSGI